MTKTQAAQRATAYAESLPAAYHTRIVEMPTRFIVLAHTAQYKIKCTFKFDSEYANHDQGC